MNQEGDMLEKGDSSHQKMKSDDWSSSDEKSIKEVPYETIESIDATHSTLDTNEIAIEIDNKIEADIVTDCQKEIDRETANVANSCANCSCKSRACQKCGREVNNNLLKQSGETTVEINPSDSSTFTPSHQQSIVDLCRICQCDDDTAVGVLITPCNCKGSLAYVHHSCLQRWIKSSGFKSCELCGFQFEMNAKLKPITQWEKLSLTKTERRKIFCSVVFHIIALTCVVWSMYILIERTATDIQHGQLQWPFWTKLVVVAIGLTGGLAFMYVQCKAYNKLWKRLKAFNRMIWVQNRPGNDSDKSKDGSANVSDSNCATFKNHYVMNSDTSNGNSGCAEQDAQHV